LSPSLLMIDIIHSSGWKLLTIDHLQIC